MVCSVDFHPAGYLKWNNLNFVVLIISVFSCFHKFTLVLEISTLITSSGTCMKIELMVWSPRTWYNLCACLLLLDQTLTCSLIHRYINELIEHIYLAIKKYGFEQAGDDHSPVVDSHMHDHVLADFQHHSSDPTSINACNRGTDLTSSNCNKARELSLEGSGTSHDEYLQHLSAEWARPLEAASQRRAEVLMPENLENMWTKGKNHRKEVKKYTSTGVQAQGEKGSEVNSVSLSKDTEKGSIAQKPEFSTKNKAQASAITPCSYPSDLRLFSQRENAEHLYREPGSVASFKAYCISDEFSDALVATGNRSKMKKSNSTSDMVILPDRKTDVMSKIGGPIISEFYSPNSSGHNQMATVNSASRMVLSSQAHTPKLKSRVGLVSLSLSLPVNICHIGSKSTCAELQSSNCRLIALSPDHIKALLYFLMGDRNDF